VNYSALNYEVFLTCLWCY